MSKVRWGILSTAKIKKRSHEKHEKAQKPFLFVFSVVHFFMFFLSAFHPRNPQANSPSVRGFQRGPTEA